MNRVGEGSEGREGCFIGNILLYIIFVLFEGTKFFDSNTSQIIAILSVFLIIFIKPQDNIIRLPKRFFYWFYPTHIAIFVIIKWYIASVLKG